MNDEIRVSEPGDEDIFCPDMKTVYPFEITTFSILIVSVFAIQFFNFIIITDLLRLIAMLMIMCLLYSVYLHTPRSILLAQTNKWKLSSNGEFKKYFWGSLVLTVSGFIYF